MQFVPYSYLGWRPARLRIPSVLRADGNYHIGGRWHDNLFKIVRFFRNPMVNPPVFWADGIYHIGGRWHDNLFFKIVRYFRKPMIMHWIGTDVSMVREADKIGGQISWPVLEACNHWTEVKWTAEELGTVGIRADVVPLTSTLPVENINPLPNRFTVLVYLPSNRPLFYGAHHILRLAREMPEIQFKCVGFNESPFHFTSDLIPTNVELLGRPDTLGKIYQESTVLIRMTDHDGLSFMVLEALLHGRYVIWSHSLGNAPGALAASNYETLYRHVETLYTQSIRGGLAPNYEGAKFVHAHYDPADIAKDIRCRIRALIQPVV